MTATPGELVNLPGIQVYNLNDTPYAPVPRYHVKEVALKGTDDIMEDIIEGVRLVVLKGYKRIL
eukprot:4295-Eustigmatos_ZCMA.PRE.1